MTVLTVIVFLMLIVAFVYMACIHEENKKMDDILSNIDDNARKNMVVKLQGTKLTPTEECKYKISDDMSRDVGDLGAIQELESISYSHRKWRANQEKEFKKARLTVLI